MEGKKNQTQVQTRFGMEVAITIRSSCFDAEASTILTSMVHGTGHTKIRSLNVGKLIRMTVNGDSVERAKALTASLCDDVGYYNAVNLVEINAVAPVGEHKSASASTTPNGLYIVDAIISSKEGVPNPETEAVLQEVGARGYGASIGGITVSQLLRMEVESETVENAMVYVSDFDKEYQLHLPLIHTLELRPATPFSA